MFGYTTNTRKNILLLNGILLVQKSGDQCAGHRYLIFQKKYTETQYSKFDG